MTITEKVSFSLFQLQLVSKNFDNLLKNIEIIDETLLFYIDIVRQKQRPISVSKP